MFYLTVQIRERVYVPFPNLSIGKQRLFWKKDFFFQNNRQCPCPMIPFSKRKNCNWKPRESFLVLYYILQQPWYGCLSELLDGSRFGSILAVVSGRWCKVSRESLSYMEALANECIPFIDWIEWLSTESPQPVNQFNRYEYHRRHGYEWMN